MGCEPQGEVIPNRCGYDLGKVNMEHEIKRALTDLITFCTDQPEDCSGCPFKVSSQEDCYLNNELPANWDLRKF